MKENEPQGSLEDFAAPQEQLEAFEGIFTNEDEQTKSLRENAAALGINPDLVAREDGPQLRFFARRNCKHCFGRGLLNVVISPSSRKVFWKNERKPRKVSFRQTKAARSRRLGATRPITKNVLSISEGHESEWDTRLPEPQGFKKDNLSQSFCRCIRAVEV